MFILASNDYGLYTYASNHDDHTPMSLYSYSLYGDVSGDSV